MLTGMYVFIILRAYVDRDCIENYERSIHVDRDVGIDKITSDQFMLTGM